MLASITPLGERGRRRRWGTTVTAHIVAAALGGAATGAVAGAAGWVLLRHASPDTRLGLLAALIGAGLLADLTGWIPGPRRQVDESWLDRYRGWVYGAGFGLQLGAGVVTIVTASATYVVLGAALASASPAAGAAIGAIAGLLRGATVLAAARVRSPGQLVGFHARMRAWSERARLAGLAAHGSLLLAAAGALAA
jgi:hypothetical protein